MTTGHHSRQLRLLYATASLEQGGLQKRCVQIASAAAQQGHQVWLATAQTGPLADALDPACELVDLATPPPFRRGGPGQLWRLLGRLWPDVVHGFTNVGCYFAVPLARLRGVPATVATMGNAVDDPLLSRMEWRLAGLPLHFAHAVTGNSREVVDSARRILHLPVAHLHHIPNYVDLERFPYHDAELRAAVRAELAGRGVPVDAWLLGTVGRLVAQKDPETFLRCAAAVPAQIGGRPVHWVWAGDGNQRPAVEGAMAGHGLKDRMHLLGNRNDIPRLLQGLDLFVLSSAYEGMPNAVLEALAVGLPVVSTRVAGTDVLVREGATGWLVDIGDAPALAAAVREALADPDRLAHHGRQARRLVQHGYTREAVVPHYFELYDQLLRPAR